ncbi:hypothetical protein BW897_11050 [Bacillus cereus]|uniref:Uncharacterized protein n=1 Tax=Bacillus cereus TaxID=1396 RepID=A0A1S9TRP4_BACCE|nr:hypothetical protein [Bacillus cereus]OOR12642.1 hypothetical protein BW897_11050 [Bacillus cereus]
MKKEKPYFDPYVFQKVLEDVWFPPYSNQVLKPWNVSAKQKFLFCGFEKKVKRYLEEEQKLIRNIVNEEMNYYLSCVEGYIRPSEEDRKRWFEKLRRDLELPPNYKFE